MNIRFQLFMKVLIMEPFMFYLYSITKTSPEPTAPEKLKYIFDAASLSPEMIVSAPLRIGMAGAFDLLLDE